MVLERDGKIPRGLLVVFYLLIAAFLALVAIILFDPLEDLMGLFFLPLTALSFALGLTLLVLAVRWRLPSPLRTLWIVTGAGPMGLAVGSVLHNVFYAVGSVTGQSPVVQGAAGALEVAFFILGVLIAPIAFVVGAIGAIVALILRQRRAPPAAEGGAAGS